MTSGPSTSTPRAGPKSWKRKIARAKEEKTFAHVDDLLMSDSEDELEDSRSATDNLNETENVVNTEEDEMSDYSDEFEIDDLGCSNLMNQPQGGQSKAPGTGSVRSECRICSQILPTARLSAHEALPHPVPCTQDGCGKKFILEKTLERHIRRAHTPKAPTPTLVSTQLSRNEGVDRGDELMNESNSLMESSIDSEPAVNQVSVDDSDAEQVTQNYKSGEVDVNVNLSVDEPEEHVESVAALSNIEVGDESAGNKELELTPGSKNKVLENLDLKTENSESPDEIEDGKADVENNEVSEGNNEDEKSPQSNEADKSVVESSHLDNQTLENDQLKEKMAEFEEPPGPYICKFCKEEYKSWGTLTRHFITPHLFKCEFCDLVFNRRSTLEDHTNMLHGLVGLIDSTHCSMCGETFSRSSTLARHIAAPHNFPCKKCEMKFQSKLALSKHNSVCPNKHIVIEEEEPEKKPPKRRKRNAKKGLGSPSKRTKKSKKDDVIEDELSESDMDSNENSIVDPVDREDSKSNCSMLSTKLEDDSSEDEMNLSERLKAKSKKAKTAEESEDSDKSEEEERPEPKSKKAKITRICDVCGQTISGGPGSLRSHQARDHKFACDQCDKRFVMKSRLKVHQDTIHKSEIYEFECKLCLFRLYSGTKISMTLVKNKIDKHRSLTHNFSCDDCDLKFVSAERLSYHKSNSHGSEFTTDYHCIVCDKVIENKDDTKRIKEFLDHNETVHSFSCDYCPLKFVTSLALKKHSEDKHKNETHCHKCKIEFSQEELHRHVKNPHPFDCDECDFHFITEERLKYHGMNLHDKEETIATVCSECSVTIEELEDFLNHIEVKHREECDNCNLSFIDEVSLNKHVESEHPKKELICCQCGQNFADVEVDYEKHIEIEHKHKCRFCDKVFIKKLMLLEHISNDHSDLEFDCKLCGKQFKKSFEDFARHEEEKHDKECRYCEKKFIRRTSLISHVTSEHVDKNFFCKFCSQDFGREFEKCLKHEDVDHEFKCENCDKCYVDKSVHDKHSLDVHGVSVGLDLKCGQCQARFSNTGAFREHFKVPHKVYCSLCELRFPTYNNLNEHISKAHQKNVKAEKLSCKLCSKKFESKEKAEYEEHQNMTHKYKCDNCDMMFVKSGRLRDHIDESHGHSKSIDDKFTCKLCRTICNKKNDMKLSKDSYKMHCSLPHKFPCRNCDLRFTNKSKLDTHMQESHTGGSANECPTCGSRFSDLHKLRDHKNESHKFNCKDLKCKKRFVNELSLEKHLQRKHKEFAQATFKDGQILYRCKMCSKSFDANLALQSHQYIKHSYKCHLCEHSYTEKDDLTIHLVKSHRVDKIPQAGFRCKLCKMETKKMIEIRKHASLSHKYQCSFCKLKYTNKNQLDVHMEENHMDQVMMAMAGGEPIDEDEALDKQPHLARLGVNVLLWAGSRQVGKHLHRVMEGKTSSTRHKLFLNKQEREECCRSEDSKLYKMSGSRFFSLPTPTDQALLEVCSETYRSGQPILHGITKDRFTFEYVASVLIPEIWILYFRKLKGLSSEEAEKLFVEKPDPEKTLAAWKEFEEAISIWKTKENKPEVSSSDQKRKSEDKDKRKSSDPRLSKSGDPRLSRDSDSPVKAETYKVSPSPDPEPPKPNLDEKVPIKSSDPRLRKSSDPRLIKANELKTHEPVPVVGAENNQVPPKISEEAMSAPNPDKGNAKEASAEAEEGDFSKAEAEELDTIAQFLEASS